MAGLFAWLSAGSRRREASEWRRLLTRHGFIILKDSNVLNLFVLTNRLHFLTKQFISLPFRQTSELHGIQVGSGHGRDSGDGRSWFRWHFKFQFSIFKLSSLRSTKQRESSVLANPF